jgi:hypothetical protein
VRIMVQGRSVLTVPLGLRLISLRRRHEQLDTSQLIRLLMRGQRQADEAEAAITSYDLDLYFKILDETTA